MTPKGPEVSLLTSADELSATMTVFETVDGKAVARERPLTFSEWKNGVSARSTLCMDVDTRETCEGGGDLADRTPGDDGDVYEFKPGRTEAFHGCPSGSIDTGEEDVWTAEARAALDAKLAFEVERELWTGAKTGNPSLQQLAVPISEVPPVKATTAMALLIANWNECSKGVLGMIHVPEPLIVDLDNQGVLYRQGNRFMTITGHIVVPGSGYPATPGTWGPITDDDPDGMEAPDGAAWVMMSPIVEFGGPHRVEVNAPNVEGAPQYWDPRLNRFETVESDWWITRFDTCGCVFAALAKLPI